MASSSASTLYRRPAASSARPNPAGALRPDVEPPPRSPRPVFQLLAFGLLLLFACLQFLPATHFRHPADPHRSWIPFDNDGTASMSTDTRSPDEEKSDILLNHDEEAGKIHLFSWANCLDIRMLAVLVNSTLSSSSLPENVYFHFFIPDGEEVKLSYYKLKVLFPNSNINVIGQSEIKEKLSTAIPEGELLWPLLHEIAPLVVPSINPSWKRFIYVSPDIIIKGKIEEFFSLDLGDNAIAAAEDCSRRLGDYVKIDVVNAIQRTSAKPWLSLEPYDGNACTPDLSVLLFNTNKFDKDIVGSILWWSKVLDLGNDRRNQVNPAITLALYNKYLKLSSAWKLGESVLSKMDNETKVLHFDGPRKVCPEDHSRQYKRSLFGNIWQQYLPPKSDAILNR